MRKAERRRLGIIGGLGSLGGADIFFKLVQPGTAIDQKLVEAV